MINNVAEERILEAAIDVIAENTISETRMHLIAERAGMVQSNVHYYYKTKKDLLLAALDALQNVFSNERKHIVPNANASLRDLLNEFFEQKNNIILNEPKYDRVQIDYWSLGQIDDEINESFIETYNIWREHITSVIDNSLPDMDTQKKSLVASVMISMMMGAALQYLNNKKAFDLDKYWELCLNMVMCSLEDPVDDN